MIVAVCLNVEIKSSQNFPKVTKSIYSTFFKSAHPSPFFIYFRRFKHTLQIEHILNCPCYLMCFFETVHRNSIKVLKKCNLIMACYFWPESDTYVLLFKNWSSCSDTSGGRKCCVQCDQKKITKCL